jgi:hypothetical protein
MKISDSRGRQELQNMQGMVALQKIVYYYYMSVVSPEIGATGYLQ